jgi:hypothetical protein
MNRNPIFNGQADSTRSEFAATRVPRDNAP